MDGDNAASSRTTETSSAANENTAKLSIVQKLALNGLLGASEACFTALQLYSASTLQRLGIPVHLLSVFVLVSGPCGLISLSVLGWAIDRGPNPRRRKMLAVLLCTSILVTGLVCIVVANVLRLTCLDSTSCDTVTSHGVSGNDTTSATSTRKPNLPEPETLLWTASVPFSGLLAFFGFAFLDWGFDNAASFTRSWILACSPVSEHNAVLKLGVVVSAFGCVPTIVLAMLDFETLLGLKRSSVNVAMFVQGPVLLILVIVGTVLTVVTGHNLSNRNRTTIPVSMQDKASSLHNSSDRKDISSTAKRETEDALGDERNKTLTVLTPNRGVENRLQQIDSEEANGHAFAGSIDAHNSTDCTSETFHVLSYEHFQPMSGQDTMNHLTSSVRRYGSQGKTDIPTRKLSSTNENCGSDSSLNRSCSSHSLSKLLPDSSNESNHHASQPSETTWMFCRPKRKRGFKCQVMAICLGTYFSTASIVMFDFLSADYLGKAVYGGKPAGEGVGEDVKKYQQSMRVSATGFLVYSVAFLFYSLLQHRLLDVIGYKVEFLLSQSLLAGCFVCLALTARLEPFFVLASAAGIRRASISVVPFKLINDLAQQEVKQENGEARVGVAMSAVTLTLPLSTCTLYTWVGALESSTGLLSAPLWLGAGYALLAALSFMPLTSRD